MSAHSWTFAHSVDPAATAEPVDVGTIAHPAGMWQAIVGTDAVAAGMLTRGKLRWNYSALHPRIYMPNGVEPNLFTRAHAAWLWKGGTGVIAGRAAAAFHGSRWVDANVPIELLARHGRRQSGIIVRQERFDSDEVTLVAGLPVTTPARTALDIARHLPRDLAVPQLDALAVATGVTPADVAALTHRYPGARGIRRARMTLPLMDEGAQSPKESWVRLVLLDAGLPKPRTQIRVSDGYRTAFIDLGWDEPKIGIDYDGEQHRSDRRQFVRDIGRYDMIERQGWIDLRVVAEHSARFIVQRVRDAFARRGYWPSSTPGS
jgi:very-short-patch-repair endonuclease